MTLLNKRLSSLLNRKVRVLSFLEEQKIRFEQDGKNTSKLTARIEELKIIVAKLQTAHNRKNGNGLNT